MTRSGKEDAGAEQSGGTRRRSQETQGAQPSVPTGETLAAASAGTRSMSGLDDHHRRMLATAQDRLERLFLEAVGGRFYGRVSIEVAFENGRPLTIRRRIKAVDT